METKDYPEWMDKFAGPFLVLFLLFLIIYDVSKRDESVA